MYCRLFSKRVESYYSTDKTNKLFITISAMNMLTQMKQAKTGQPNWTWLSFKIQNQIWEISYIQFLPIFICLDKPDWYIKSTFFCKTTLLIKQKPADEIIILWRIRVFGLISQTFQWKLVSWKLQNSYWLCHNFKDNHVRELLAKHVVNGMSLNKYPHLLDYQMTCWHMPGAHK